MKIKNTLSHIWKLTICGIAYFIGMAISGALLPMIGLQAPEAPAGTDANTIALWFFLGSILIALTLSFVSRRLRANWLVRTVILAELVWVLGTVGMVIESFFFMTTGAVSSILSASFTMLNFLLPSLFLSATVAALFRPDPQLGSCLQCLQNFFSARRFLDWLWRITIVLMAYPLTYFVFGLIVQPYIKDFYTAGQFELTIPTWGQMIPLQLGRSLLFLIVCLPVVVWWGGSRRRLCLALGFSIFLLTAFMAVITSYWFPWQMRLFHGLELLADALVYAGVLTWLFAPGEDIQAWQDHPSPGVIPISQ